MAKQVGPVFFTGTIDGIIFYKLGDKYYSRSKGSYKSAKHMRRNPRYQRTMQQADQFGEASKLTQEVYYRYLPKAVRKFGLFGKLTGIANRFLQQGKSREEVLNLLITQCQTLQQTATSSDTAPALSKTLTETPVASKQQQLKNRKPITTKVKQARYLSRWKVKPNGRLQVPKSLTANCLTAVPCHTIHDPILEGDGIIGSG